MEYKGLKVLLVFKASRGLKVSVDRRVFLVPMVYKGIKEIRVIQDLPGQTGQMGLKVQRAIRDSKVFKAQRVTKVILEMQVLLVLMVHKAFKVLRGQMDHKVRRAIRGLPEKMARLSSEARLTP